MKLLFIVLMGMMLIMPLPRKVMQAAVRLWAGTITFALRWLTGIRYEIRGQEKLPKTGGIVASKHQSVWETAIFYRLLPDPAYVLKKELMRIPVWAMAARKAGGIAVDREGGASALKDMVRRAAEATREGRNVIIFPEGTRTAPDSDYDYHPGVAAIYKQAGCQICPVALNSGLFWGRHQFLKYPGTITLEVLDPIEPGLDRRTLLTRQF